MDTHSVMICDGVQMEEPARKRFCPDFLSTGSGSSSCDGVNVNDDDDDDKESVYSWQSYETAWAADSVDDWSLSDPDEVDSLTEFEIVDEDSTVLESQSSDSSSSLEITNVHFPEGLLPAPLADSSSSFTDESGWDDPNGETDSNFDNSQSQTSWKCLKCRAPTSAPRNFCFTCYQKRKSSRPPRPVRRSKKPGRTKPSGTSLDTDCAMLISAPGASNDNNMCTVCHVGIRDGAFVHRKTAHVAACYACTLKISRKPNAKCPICRQSIQNTIKIFFN
ncbi:hypothetical protein DAPPUDRAFT_301859 [Daphnia pulex]|uniref:RING-type domain-containing protein n=1 Tax=Daphnia pulex TaxID=6669 RepID=E9GAU5_DAPPU|nr:hypothetical protein DAPPUDRAFT_301859 [Daphnia pulex]|eukprot:EFX83318.1 hypothetical protein DAPPUDRAFT_301859 [Daphnia pulex]